MWIITSSAQEIKPEDYRAIFDTIDYRINEGNGYKDSTNLNNILGWGESRIMMGYAEMYCNTSDTYYLDKLSDHIDHVLANRDDHCGYKDFRGESKAGWSSEQNNNPGVGNRRTVLDGMIIYPMIQFVEFVYNNPDLSHYKDKADHYLSEVEMVFTDHQDNWVEGPDTQVVDISDADNNNIVFTITVKADDGKTDLYYRLITPPDYDPSKKYPAIVYVYGGPHVQLVSNSWLGGSRLWQFYMESADGSDH